MTMVGDLPPDWQASRAALVEALAAGAKRVVFRNGSTSHEVEYHSLDDIRRGIEHLDREIAAAQGRKLHTFKPYFPRDW